MTFSKLFGDRRDRLNVDTLIGVRFAAAVCVHPNDLASGVPYSRSRRSAPSIDVVIVDLRALRPQERAGFDLLWFPPVDVE
jgi:hypothetical protein